MMKLYHTSAAIIKKPDIYYGRRNADFGGGFYLSDSHEFAAKWAGENTPHVNHYTLDLTGLSVREFTRDGAWFDYIANNRAGNRDSYADADVIIGPIASDTLYDTYGIVFSGLLSDMDALRLLKVGDAYTQINIKSEKAAAQLHWEGAETLTAAQIAAARETVKAEESAFRTLFEETLKSLSNYEEIEQILG